MAQPGPGGAALQDSLRRIPSVAELLRSSDHLCGLPRPLAVQVIRSLTEQWRQVVREGGSPPAAAEWPGLVAAALQAAAALLFGRVINATGVVLHTNLGRAPLAAQAVVAVAAVAGGYTNLEYNLESGERGSRHVHGEVLLQLATGAEAAMVVNNGAAAILLALTAVASGREVILSRGQMIEIGGSFRVPEIMAQSGCRLVEVGTTNRTHLRDYEQAITPATGAILLVHPSNYRIEGFTSSVPAHELAQLAERHGIPLLVDLGSGVLLDTADFGLAHEPTISETVAAGPHLVTCSGDKLLGGPQAGLIVGRRALIDLCRRHPLARALRVGKLTLAALQATLALYLNGSAAQDIPIWRMCGLSKQAVAERAAALAGELRAVLGPDRVRVAVIDGESTVGGGALPGETIPTALLAIQCPKLGATGLARCLRRWQPPVIARIEAERLLVDLRTVDPGDDHVVLAALLAALGCAE